MCLSKICRWRIFCLPNPKESKRSWASFNFLDADNITSCFLTVSGMEYPPVYQIIFRNLIKVAGPCAVCKTVAYPFSVSLFAFMCSNECVRWVSSKGDVITVMCVHLRSQRKVGSSWDLACRDCVWLGCWGSPWVAAAWRCAVSLRKWRKTVTEGPRMGQIGLLNERQWSCRGFQFLRASL